MSSTINASTASGGGVITSADASGILQLQTAGVTALSISAAQVVSFTNPVTLVTPTIDSAQVPTVSGTAPLYMCRAWVNFNGTGTPAIRASGNVTSITDNGTGSYSVNFTTAMPDANYSATANVFNTVNSDMATFVNGSFGTTTLAVNTVATGTNLLVDVAGVFVAVFR